MFGVCGTDFFWASQVQVTAEFGMNTGLMYRNFSKLQFNWYFHFPRNKRKERHGQIVINITSALSGLYITYAVAVFEDLLHSVICAIVAAGLHYFLMVYIGLVGMEGIYLFMESFRSSKRSRKPKPIRTLQSRMFWLAYGIVWGESGL